MIFNQTLYEINTRVFLRRYDTETKKARLKDVPLEYWKSLSELGFNLIWLMGVWKTNESIIEKCCYEEGLRSSYDKALKDWSDEDVIGSPYAVDEYVLNPDIATVDEFLSIKEYINSLDMQLILDFVPNHLSAESAYIKTNPEIFLQCKNDLYGGDRHTFFAHSSSGDIVFAHGRDPFFPAWTDTIQINYFATEARKFMTDRLMYIASLCDGVRCDMAMLILNNVFQNTWGGVLTEQGFTKPKSEFWREAITTVAKEHPQFIFLAEAYWDLEWDLQQLGFDFTYDKRLLDRLKNAPTESIKSHFHAESSYQKKSVRFLENHDEDRAVTSLGRERSIAAAIVISTVPGLRFFHDGQLEGRKIKLPVQLGREPKEQVNLITQAAYKKLLGIIKKDVFKDGEWQLLDAIPSWPDNELYQNMLAWEWSAKQERILVIVNYSKEQSQCRVKLELPGYAEQLTLYDLWGGGRYERSSSEVVRDGLFVDLAPWSAHIMEF